MRARGPRVAGLVASVAIAAAAVGGCAYHEPERVATVPPAPVITQPVVVAQPMVVSPSPVVSVSPAPVTVVQAPVAVASTQRVVTYPEGRWQLYGAGTTTSPFYWAWMPAGTAPPVPPALPSPFSPVMMSVPSTAVVAPPLQRVVTYPDGRWQLYGEGSTTLPYYWVWVPNGMSATVPPPMPPLPQSG